MNDFAGKNSISGTLTSAAASCAEVRRPGRFPRALWLGCLLAPALLGLAACQDPKERAQQLAQQADALAQAGNIVGAQEAIRSAIALREDDPALHTMEGAIAMRAGDPVSAYRAFQRALEFDETNKMALAYVANIGVQLGQTNEADQAADRLLTLEPDAIPGLQVKGMVALSREKYDKAIEFGDRILAIQPGQEAGAIIKARALAKQGKAEEALKMLDGAIGTSSNSAALITNKLNVYRFMRQPEPMLPLLNALVEKTNGAPIVRLDQINLLYKLGKVEDARKSSIALLAAGSRSPDDYRTLQRIWWQNDQTPVPAGTVSAANWKDPIALVMTVRYLFTRGDLKSADALLRTASPSAQGLTAGLRARVFAASGRVADARKQVDALLIKDDHDVDALLLKAGFAMQDNKPEAALQAAQLAQTNDPLNPETYVVLARVYRSQGSEFRARQIFEEGLKNLPQNFYLVESYTQFLHELGDKGRAVSVTRTFARSMPASVRAWSILAAQCQWAGDQTCLQSAATGLKDAQTNIVVDDPPGAPQNRGLFGRI